ncbi:hypothetical protein C8J57DRAFT_1257674 [Mycena rebaudengoi]|nr:hypothetical protein C8J57DRAFT_1257674 [Mycena rebaudengoi]
MALMLRLYNELRATWYFKHASKRGSFLEALFKGPKQNASINEAYCLGCIRHHRCVEDPPNNTDLVLKDRLKWEEAAFTAVPIWVISGQRKSCTDQGSTTSVDLTYDKSDTAPTSKKRKRLFRNVKKAMKQPELYSHSTKGQLILSDYLAVNEEASVVAEQATDLIHWILSHDRVRKIFDDAQPENNFVVLVYPLANIT